MAERDLYAAIDLGSNSFHMLVARREHGELRIIDRIKEMVRLAGGIGPSGRLDDRVRERALDCLARFGQRIAAIPDNQVRAVGTQSFRQLSNPSALLVVAETALGCPIEIVSGREEARLIYLGVSQATASDDRRLVIDIGGGSTELVVGESLDPHLAESVPVGCVSMTRRFFDDGRLERGRWQQAVESVQDELLELSSDIARMDWRHAVGSSGTIRALGTIAARRRGEASNHLSLAEIEDLRERLLAAGHVDALDLDGLSERRRPVIAGGASVLEAVMKSLAIESLEVSPHALREGLLHDLIGRLAHQDPRARTVRAMASRYQCDPQQSARVRDWAMQAADQAAEAWCLTDIHRELLDWACQLHEIGLGISHDRHQVHGAYLVEHADMPGFSRQEQHFMATLIVCQRRRLNARALDGNPTRLHEPLRRLIALLRLAVVMCRPRNDADIPDFALTARDQQLTLQLPAGWLASRPLTARGLAEQCGQLAELDIRLDLSLLPEATPTHD